MYPDKLFIGGMLALRSLAPRQESDDETMGVKIDPVQQYLGQMCYPLLNNNSRSEDLGLLRTSDLFTSLANSPFPCEQTLYMRQVCQANGTTEIDFLAEQQCICNGAYEEASAGCENCYKVHGYQYTDVSPAEATSTARSIQSRLCSVTPPCEPYENIQPFTIDVSNMTTTQTFWTLGDDKFPSDTATSNYFTATEPLTVGQITGSATKRLTSFTNTGHVKYTGTCPTRSQTTDGSATTEAPSGTAAGNSATPTSSGNAAPAPLGVGLQKEGVFGGLLAAAGLGAMAFL